MGIYFEIRDRKVFAHLDNDPPESKMVEMKWGSAKLLTNAKQLLKKAYPHITVIDALTLFSPLSKKFL